LEEWRGQAGDRSHIDRIRDEIRQARKQAPDVEVLLGAEIDADPWAVDGTLMMEDLSGIDCVMGSTHVFPGGFGFWFEPIHIDDPRLRRRLVQDWFDWVEQLVAREEIDILAHPGCEIAARALIPSFAEDWLRMRMVHLGGMMARHKVAFELNEALLHKLPSACAATYGEFVRTVAAQGVKFAIGTDSHRPATIGRYAWVMELVDNAGLRTRDFLRLERGRRG
jgi:histidinol phosphatase-like PHP family hydrolase